MVQNTAENHRGTRHMSFKSYGLTVLSQMGTPGPLPPSCAGL